MYIQESRCTSVKSGAYRACAFGAMNWPRAKNRTRNTISCLIFFSVTN